ncbi:MAG: peptidoglycan-binding protein [Gammaproteobacteria bacterium]|nr:peptidoglycan-binding protein [Gammaproteobacteria bacterium]
MRPAPLVRITLLLAVLSVTDTTRAADSDGNYMVKGAGTADCATFAASVKQRDQRFFSFAGWIEGYLSGMNRYEGDVYDLVSWQSTDLLMASLSKYCEQNPQMNFHTAVTNLAGSLKRNAIEENTPLVPIDAGDGRAYLLYEKAIRRLQARLRLHGLYEGELTGSYGDTTRDAVRRFQESKGLAATGLPDQETLSYLLN